MLLLLYQRICLGCQTIRFCAIIAIAFYRLSNKRELDSFLEEVSGLTGKKELLSIYKVATEEEYSFLYVNLAARNAKEMFYKNFTGRIQLEDVSND